MTADVQYGPEVASVYDWFISRNIPVGPTLERLRPAVTGARVLELGVGTGRVALPVAALAERVVGLDNSPAMLARLRAKELPANLDLVEADVRHRLPLTGRFQAAYATLGSLACVRSRAELGAALAHVRQVLEPGAAFCFDLYSVPLYRQLADLGPVTIPTEDPAGTATCTVDVDGDRLTTGTTVDPLDAPSVHFSEQVLLIAPDEVRALLAEAGFTDVHVEPAGPHEPYDWYRCRAGSGAAPTDRTGGLPC
ncbi:methyltransferase domain-containing protein [Modestobacter sp. I12A-02628]|uniref:Class I SAM-dependent methyltransferase n=1 Tax=Goekera deserti TaxID=2497753 RepID=A0A7K3W9D3_9ACTN|nr:class I SAM-dependent methyltransferase [Goekera deserti]MPQ98767.1 methyltransferase domain-containing protein [Goekera deserti]NDI49736.1 methyltransferase domain-containing protein [Goekera deserti]NEL53071.1 class I SAM-dependent methyltransferase [Goekera deserti]